MTEKLRESALSVVPIAAIVSVMCLCVIPTETDLLLSFLVGTAFIILGMGLFSLGAEQSICLDESLRDFGRQAFAIRSCFWMRLTR